MAISYCPTCGHSVEEPRPVQCPNCGAALPGSTVPATGVGGPPAAPPGTPSSVPFEDRSRPFFERFFETVKLAFSNPVALFSNMPAEDIGPPLVYGLIIGVFANIFYGLWQILFGSFFTALEGGGGEAFFFSTGFMLLLMLFSPVLVTVGLFVSAGIYHLMLLLVGDGSRGFGVTMRAVCYGNTPGLLSVVPLCGGMIAGIWIIVLVILGGIHGHHTDTWRAVVAYFLPLVAICCVVMVLAFTLGFVGSMAK